MRYLSLLIVLLCCAFARAEHHRDHVREFIAEIDRRILFNEYERYWRTLTPAQRRDRFVRASDSYIRVAQFEIWMGCRMVEQILDDGTPEELRDVARKIIAQPRFDQFNPAMSTHAHNIFLATGFLLPTVNDRNVIQLKLAMDQFRQVWTMVQLMEWHINDAILEEVHNDPTVGGGHARLQRPACPPNGLVGFHQSVAILAL
jgi:hypothetical protein